MHFGGVVAGCIGVAIAAAATRFFRSRWRTVASKTPTMHTCMRCRQAVIPFGSSSPVCSQCLGRVVDLPLTGLFSPSTETAESPPNHPEAQAAMPPAPRPRYKRCKREDVTRLFGDQ
jgi:hypothetical protein